MRGEERGGPFSTRTAFTVGCRDAQRDMRATDCHQQVPARSECTDIDGSVRWWGCAVREKEQMSTRQTESELSKGADHVAIVLNLDMSVVLVNGRKSVVVLLTARRSRDNR